MIQRPGLSHGVVLALGLVMALNYVDRSSLATAAPLLQDELSLSNARMGLLLSAFFWAYTPGQLLGGWLVHRFAHDWGANVAWVLPSERSRQVGDQSECQTVSGW